LCLKNTVIFAKIILQCHERKQLFHKHQSLLNFYLSASQLMVLLLSYYITQASFRLIHKQIYNTTERTEGMWYV